MLKSSITTFSQRESFFDNQVYHPKWVEKWTTESEEKCIKIIEELGYLAKYDFACQFPIGQKYILDIAFPDLKICIEIDGKEHSYPKRKKEDFIRDNNLYLNNWVVIRIKNEDLDKEDKILFYRNLMQGVIEERKQQLLKGELYQDNKEFIVL
jgi:very-short-patch-repair endonuclease